MLAAVGVVSIEYASRDFMRNSSAVSSASKSSSKQRLRAYKHGWMRSSLLADIKKIAVPKAHEPAVINFKTVTCSL